MLNEKITELRYRLRKALNQEVQEKDIVLIGAGGLCDVFFQKEQALANKVVSIYDSYPKENKMHLNGIKIEHIANLEGNSKDNCIYVLTSGFHKELLPLLESYGVTNIISYHYIYFYENWRLDNSKLQLLDDLREELQDAASKKTLDKLIAIRNNLVDENYEDIYDEEQYYKSFLNFSDDEVFVDAGAFDGREINDFKNKVDDKFNKIYSFELSPLNYQKIKEKSLGDPRVETFNLGLWSQEDYFEVQESGPSAKVVFSKEKNSSNEPNLVSLDEILANKAAPTFIKMDIEGAELEALKGAQNIIRRHKPKLAICLYHKPEDIWEIPAYIKSLVPEYKFYIRHHSKVIWETVLYAVVK